MFRKTILAIAAVGALGAAALAPTSAFAWKGGGFGHHHFGFGGGFGGIYIGPSVATYDDCMQKRWVDTRFGPRLRWVNVCTY